MPGKISSRRRRVFTHTEQFEPFTLGGGVTIDTATGQYDDGFLACARTGWPNPKADSTFVQAAQNLGSYRQRDVESRDAVRNTSLLVLVGHGTTGLISTGDGEAPRTAEGYISSATYGTWESYFASIRGHGTFLTLCGCDCGGGVSGAQFLYQLATLLNIPVQGRTGLVYLTCPGAILSYENGSVWQVAQPGVMPTPINPPSGSARSSIPKYVWLNGSGDVPFSAIESVTISTSGGRSVDLNGSQINSLIYLANIDEPLTASGNLGAVRTGQVSIGYKNGGKRVRAVLSVYNDRILRHTDEPSTFNRCAPGFGDEFRRLLSQ